MEYSVFSETSPTDGHVVSVVIPTIRSDQSIEQVKAALHQQNRPPDEIIVVHDINRNGPAWARNKGISLSSGDLVAFLDDDCLPPIDWLQSLVSAIDKHHADGAGGTYIETQALLISRRKRQCFPDIEMIDEGTYVGAGGNLMMSREWLDRCKATDGHVFNEDLFIAEDWEFIIRSRFRNVKLVYCPVRVKHIKHITAIRYITEQFGRGKGIAVLYLLQKLAGNATIKQKSLLWDRTIKSKSLRWLKILWRKGIGPFDIKSFSTLGDFIVFWLGEKAQGLGFIYYYNRSRKLVSKVKLPEFDNYKTLTG